MHIEQPAASGTHPTIELTKKGEAYAAAVVAEAAGVIFLVLDSRDRTTLATTIERLIDMLDAMELDPDLEDGADDEPSLGRCGQSERQCGHHADLELDTGDDEDSLGWGQGSQMVLHASDEREEENEHGGDVVDEPHDQLDQGDDEPFLGWGDTCGQGPKVGIAHDPAVQRLDGFDPNDTACMSHLGGTSLDFSGDGYRQANDMLRAAGHCGVRVTPGLDW